MNGQMHIGFGLRFLVLACWTALTGCATSDAQPDRPSLNDSSWLAEEIDGTPVMDSPRPTIAFGADFTVSGDSSCNRYTGSATVDGRQIEFGPLATTRRACPEAVMDQEFRFLFALGEVQAWAIDAERGTLFLNNSAGRPILRFSPVMPGN